MHQPNRSMEVDARSRMGNAEMALRRYKHRLPANRSIGIKTFGGSLGPMAFTPSPFSAPLDTSPPQKQRRRSMQT
jgi:hypothetical protein